MYRAENVKAEMARSGKSITAASKEMQISFPTFSKKLANGTWTIEEANRLCDILGINNPQDRATIFFGA